MNININNIYVKIIVLIVIIVIILILSSSCSKSNDNLYVNTISNKIRQNTKQLKESTKQLKEAIKSTNNLLIIEIQKTNNTLKRILKCNQWITMGIAPYTFRSVLVCPDDKNLAETDTKIQRLQYNDYNTKIQQLQY